MKTDLTVAEIAQQSGFENPIYRAKLFKRARRMQPRRFRETHRVR